MFRIAREFEFCYGHRLLWHEGKCRFLHGHNARVLVILEGSRLDHQGMLLDFGELKDRFGRWIEENLDHRLILHRLDPVAPILQEAGETLFLLDVNPTAEHLAQLLYQEAVRLGLPVVEVVFWESPRCQAVFQGPVEPDPSGSPSGFRIDGRLILPRNPGPVNPPATSPMEQTP